MASIPARGYKNSSEELRRLERRLAVEHDSAERSRDAVRFRALPYVAAYGDPDRPGAHYLVRLVQEIELVRLLLPAADDDLRAARAARHPLEFLLVAVELDLDDVRAELQADARRALQH